MSFDIDIYNANVAIISSASADLESAYSDLCLAVSGLDSLFAETSWESDSARAAVTRTDHLRGEVVAMALGAEALTTSVWSDLDALSSMWGVS